MPLKRQHSTFVPHLSRLTKSFDKLAKRTSHVHVVLVLCLIVFGVLYLLLLNDVWCGKTISDRLYSQCGVQNRKEVQSAKGESQNLSRRLPNCIIVGVRKCGTRALLEFLDIHPQIRKVTDELHFFDDDRKYNLGLQWYARQMPVSLATDVVIEKTPAYFVTELVPERIYAMNASIKIILIVRDPVTRLISDYTQLAENKARKDDGRRVESFEEVIMFPNGKINSNYKAIRISLYAVYFFRWIKIHIVDGDQFVYDPLVELAKIESFLGLPHSINRDNFTYNTTKGFYCIRQEDNTERCLNKNKGRQHPDIHPLVIKKLHKFYDPYNKYFYKLTGKRFAWPD